MSHQKRHRWLLVGVLALVPGSGVSASLLAQAGPHLTGGIQIDVAHGDLQGNVCLANVPAHGDSVTLILNDGLTIRSLTGAAFPAVKVEEEPGGGTLRQTFSPVVTRAEPATGRTVGDICLDYSGVFPVFDVAAGQYRQGDESNVIAFNGRSIRARGVSRWYPAPYEPRLGIAAEAITFDLEVRCATCGTVFINGDRPVSGTVGKFRSEIPRELLLVAGDLPSVEVENGFILGELTEADSARSFLRTLGDLRTFLEGYMGLPYGEPPFVVRLDPVRAPRRGSIWGFYSDPSLTLIGMTVPEFVAILEGSPTPARRTILGFLGHELAHRYFGWTLGTESRQREIFGEPFATFLELKVVEYFLGEDEYRREVRRLRERVVRSRVPVSLANASADDLADPFYRYSYIPLALLALEETIGEAAMRRTLQLLVTAPPAERQMADFSTLVDAARQAGGTPEQLAHWTDTCLATNSLPDNPCLVRIGGLLE